MSAKQAVLLAVTSDQHTGSTIGLAPPEGTRRPGGQRVTPSKVQVWLWEKWVDYWRFVRQIRHDADARLICVFNGDATDGGDHHGTTEVMTPEEESTNYITRRVFSVPQLLAPDKMFMVTGTDIHVGGADAPNEVSIAEQLGCERDPESKCWAFPHLRRMFNGCLVDFQHHGRGGSRPWTAPNAMNALAAHIWMEHQLNHERAPDIAFRSHTHRFGDSYDAFPTRVIVTPAWQVKTSFVRRIGPESISTIGGVLVLIRSDGTYEVIRRTYKVALPRALAA